MIPYPIRGDRIDRTAPSYTYKLRCVDCSFEAAVEGDVSEVLDVSDAHQEEHTADPFEHFVEFEPEEPQ